MKYRVVYFPSPSSSVPSLFDLADDDAFIDGCKFYACRCINSSALALIVNDRFQVCFFCAGLGWSGVNVGCLAHRFALLEDFHELS